MIIYLIINMILSILFREIDKIVLIAEVTSMWYKVIGTIFEYKKTYLILIKRDAQTFLSEPDLMKLVP
jgi:hypothetical protein